MLEISKKLGRNRDALNDKRECHGTIKEKHYDITN